MTYEEAVDFWLQLGGPPGKACTRQAAAAAQMQNPIIEQATCHACGYGEIRFAEHDTPPPYVVQCPRCKHLSWKQFF